jgi:hypothetical protein
MVTGKFLCSATVVRIFWFTDMWARHRHARTANHRGRCPPDRISRPHMGWEYVGPPLAVRLDRSVENTYTHFLSMWIHLEAFIHLDRPRWTALAMRALLLKAFSPAINEEEGTVSLMEFPLPTRFTHTCDVSGHGSTSLAITLE